MRARSQRPARRVTIEAEQALFGERVKKLDHEERIAGGVLMHQLRQRRDALRLAAKRIGDQLPEVVVGERRKADLLHLRSDLADRVELARQRMSGIDLVVAIGADQHEVLQIRPGQQILEQVERRRVEPLQIVEKQRQRMVRSGKDTNEPAEYELETPLRLLRLKVRDRRLVSDDELQFGDEVDHELSVRTERLEKGVAPLGQLGVTLAQQAANEALESLGDRRIGNVALVLVELAGGEKAARRDQHPVQLMDDGGLADAGIAGDQHEFRRAGGHHPIEGGEQGLDLTLSPIQLLGNQELVGDVVFAERELVDAAPALPLRQAAPQVALDAGRGLVAFLGRLGEQLHGDG